MFCTQCGKENNDSATVCANCSSPLPQASSEPVTQPEVQAPPASYTAAPPPPICTASGAGIKNYLVQSILVTVLCCLGLVANILVVVLQIGAAAAAGSY